MSENNCQNNKNFPPIDYDSVLKRIDGDKDFLKELIQIYIDDFSEKFNALRSSIEKNNFELIKEKAHSIKGASANLSLSGLKEASYQLEIAGKEKNIEKAKEFLEILEKEFKKFKEFLKK
ncbi:MAG: Hpt domain-containing protein [Candidatus Aminicenantaceae bacterium]